MRDIIHTIINFILSLFTQIADRRIVVNLITDEIFEKIRKIYLSNGIPFEDFNIFGIRNEEEQKDAFNDFICVAAREAVFMFQGTTDPGRYWTENGGYNPDKQGVAHLCYGYHKNAYMIGKHGDYDALVQWGAPVKIWRDKNRNHKHDEGDIITSGYFGINIHMADKNYIAQTVGQWSAGCQVIQNPSDFKIFMELCRNSEKKKFSYMLINIKEVF